MSLIDTGRRNDLGDDPYVLDMARRFGLTLKEATRRMRLKRAKGARHSTEARRRKRRGL